MLVGAIMQSLKSIHLLLEAESLFRKIAPFSRFQSLQCKPFSCVDLVTKISEEKACYQKGSPRVGHPEKYDIQDGAAL